VKGADTGEVKPTPPHPSLFGTPPLTPTQADLLLVLAELGGLWCLSLDNRTRRRKARAYKRLALSHLVIVQTIRRTGHIHRDREVRLTANGWNALFRWHADLTGPITRERHVGRQGSKVDHPLDAAHFTASPAWGDSCGGFWDVTGHCESCGALRPLDADAYAAFVRTLGRMDRYRQRQRTHWWCAEHGLLRPTDATSRIRCVLPGTKRHDGRAERLDDIHPI
jgi:hypothetical protein